MAKQLQLRRGTTAQHSTFTGAAGEITVDTDKDVVVVHDGSTVGGMPLAKQSSVDLKSPLASPAFTGTPTINGTNVSPFTGFKNYIINGGFIVNQRSYVSGTATTSANQYTLDRWRVVTSGQNVAFSTTAGTVTVTAPAGGIEQVIEGTFIQSGTYVVSWVGTATCTLNGTAKTNGATTAITGGSNITLKFSSGTVSNVQFELGSVATPFENRPYGLELSLCERYFKSNREYIGSGTFNGYVTVSSIFGTIMRVTPTLSNTKAATDFGTVNAIYPSYYGLTFTGTGNGQGQLSLLTTLDAEL